MSNLEKPLRGTDIRTLTPTQRVEQLHAGTPARIGDVAVGHELGEPPVATVEDEPNQYGQLRQTEPGWKLQGADAPPVAPTPTEHEQ